MSDLPETGTLFQIDKSWLGRDTKSVVTADALRVCLGNSILIPVEVDREEIYRHVDTSPTEADAIIDAVLNGGWDRRRR